MPVLVRGAANDPWTAPDLLTPKQLADMLTQDGYEQRLSIIFVGFPALYRAAHIPHAMMEGPASKPESLEKLKEFARDLPKRREVVLYCGCCPFDKCPNVRPAYSALRGMGFKSLKVLVIEHNFHTDWVSKGYPTEKAS
jgi:hypothetical protein